MMHHERNGYEDSHAGGRSRTSSIFFFVSFATLDSSKVSACVGVSPIVSFKAESTWFVGAISRETAGHGAALPQTVRMQGSSGRCSRDPHRPATKVGIYGTMVRARTTCKSSQPNKQVPLYFNMHVDKIKWNFIGCEWDE